MGQLEAIRKRFDAIIPGPWRWYGNTATDQVYLATTDRGRLIILSPQLQKVQYVFDHNSMKSYDLARISNTDVQGWCGFHERGGGAVEYDSCICQDIADFLQGEVDETEGRRDFVSRNGAVDLSRSIRHYVELRLPNGFPERRKEHGGILKSHRDHVRYEVLDYRTIKEYADAHEGAFAADPSGDEAAIRELKLYREDFTGIDQPEADFVQHAPEDIGYLLELVDALTAERDRLMGYIGDCES
jgi:hypothetical protein